MMQLFKGMFKKTPVGKYLLAGGLINLAFAFQVSGHGNHSHDHSDAVKNAEFVVLQITKQGPQIRRIDVNGESQLLFSVAKGDKLFQMEHAADKPELLLSYQKKETGQQGIWRLAYNTDTGENAEASLTPVMVDDDPTTFYFDPLYSAHGADQGIYLISATLNEKTRRASKDLQLNHLNLKTRQQRIIAKNATYPSLSEQGTYLTWMQRSNSSRELKVLHQRTNALKSYTLPNAKTKVRFSRVSEYFNSMLFFSDTDNLLTGLGLQTIFDAILPKTMAHSGHKHADYFGWKLSLDKTDMTESQQQWHIQDIRGFDIAPDGETVAWITGDGLQVLDIESEERLLSIRNPNYWKLVYIN